jgi:SIR2-like domain
MIDPLTSVAFSVHSGKGVYALLLGSGISRAAHIPTGWEVTVDLIKKVAAVEDQSCGADPVAWYFKTYGKDADYSVLLEALASTPSERTNLLRGYFEPTAAERDAGDKAPTLAHKAIAKLVAKGFFRVIITTNFDRLMEQALEAEGVNPTVISTADMVKGATPLAHTDCTLVKVHGDYRDTRLRNTTAELSSYDKGMDKLLDQIFDEYGLIVCGWSGTWDTALRASILRSRNRRYSFTWAAFECPRTKRWN